jgi:proton glutamate symport protein
MSKHRIKWINFEALKSPWAILLGLCSGVYIGFFKPEYVGFFSPVGVIYLDILKMCILPIVISAISLSIGRLKSGKGDTRFIKRMLLVFAGSILIAGVVGVSLGILGGPGNSLGNDAQLSLGNIVQSANESELEISIFTPYEALNDKNILKDFLYSIVPNNIFHALTTGSMLNILFFSILFGLAVGSIKKEVSEHMMTTLEAIYVSFTQLVNWLMYLLPFGICGLLASSFSQVSIDVILSMLKFIIIALCSFVVLIILSVIVLRSRTGNFVETAKAFKEPAAIAFATANSLACLPSSLNTMQNKLGYDKENVDLLIPLTFSLCRIGPTVYFALATIFVAQLYEVNLGVSELLIVVVGSMLAGIASAGSSGIALLSLLAIVLAPLGLPFEAVIILFIVIDPIVAPFRVFTIVVSACAVTAMIMPKLEEKSGNERVELPIES